MSLNYKEMWIRLRAQLERDWDGEHHTKSVRALSLMDEFEKSEWAAWHGEEPWPQKKRKE
jgi:hypothetical protein